MRDLKLSYPCIHLFRQAAALQAMPVRGEIYAANPLSRNMVSEFGAHIDTRNGQSQSHCFQERTSQVNPKEGPSGQFNPCLR